MGSFHCISILLFLILYSFEQVFEKEELDRPIIIWKKKSKSVAYVSNIISLTFGAILASEDERKRVQQKTPLAPRAKAALKVRVPPSSIPVAIIISAPAFSK